MFNFSFRQKIILSYVAAVTIFVGLIFPLTDRTVNDLVQRGMDVRATELIEKIDQSKDDEDLVQNLKEQKALIYFRVAVISNDHKVLYDSHTKRVLGEQFDPAYVVDHREVLEAFKIGKGYNEEYSEILSQEFAYFAKAFKFHNKTYVLRIAFPLQYVNELISDFKFGFLVSSVIILLLFSIMTWFIINYYTQPIRQIITAIKPYQEGSTSEVPEIILDNKNQYDEFGQLANTFNSLSHKIRNQINSLKSFVANASHELKTPITIIHGFAETLHDNPGLPADTYADITDKIVKNCEKMTTLIKDLLTLTSIENIPESQREPCNLTILAENVVSSIQQAYPTAHIAIKQKKNANFVVSIDKNLIELALTNLVENGIKYSHPPAAITITLDQDDQWVKVGVVDKGIGIPSEEIEHIFTRFYRIDKSHSKKVGGFGLGLSIVQTIIAKHGGKIEVKSEVGKGSTFTIYLPKN